MLALVEPVPAMPWLLCDHQSLQRIRQAMAVADLEGLVVMRGGGINSSLLSEKENGSTELGLYYFCHYGFNAYHYNTNIYKQGYSTLVKKGSGG